MKTKIFRGRYQHREEKMMKNKNDFSSPLYREVLTRTQQTVLKKVFNCYQALKSNRTQSNAHSKIGLLGLWLFSAADEKNQKISLLSHRENRLLFTLFMLFLVLFEFIGTMGATKYVPFSANVSLITC